MQVCLKQPVHLFPWSGRTDPNEFGSLSDGSSPHDRLFTSRESSAQLVDMVLIAGLFMFSDARRSTCNIGP